MIYEILGTGSDNARTGRELAQALNCDIRTVTEQIERERRQGQPICASSRGDAPGYFLAATTEELETYCKRLWHRGGELFKTRRALLDILRQLQEKAGAEGGQDGKQE